MRPPTVTHPTSLADYLTELSRSVFEPGLNWQVVESKWPGIVEAFDGFDAKTVSAYTPDDVERLLKDPRIIRNRAKVEAIVHNAGEMLVIEKERGSFAEYLKSFRSFDETVADLRRRFHFLGDTGAYVFLYRTGNPVPPHEAWASAHPRHAHHA